LNWFRFHHSALNNRKVQQLKPELFKAWINIMCIGSANENRWQVPELDDVAFALRVSLEDATGYVEELISRRLLDRDDEGIWIHDWSDWQAESDDVASRVRKHRNTRNNVVTLHETNTNSSRIDKSREDKSNDVHRDARFDAWWLTYPKKVGKGEALRIWKRINPNEELFEQMVSAVHVAVTTDQWRRNNGQYIPNPATWLNQGRWSDELTVVSKPPNPRPDDYVWDDQYSEWRMPDKVGWGG
jgi:hypothetical protein